MVAETEAPALPYAELLAGAVCEEPQAERAERAKAAAAAQAELAAASERARLAACLWRHAPLAVVAALCKSRRLAQRMVSVNMSTQRFSNRIG